MSIKHYYVAWSFYPENPDVLQSEIAKLFRNADEINTKDIKKFHGIVSPHAGYIYSGQVAAYGYRLIQDNLEKISKTFILLCPSHFEYFKGVAVWMFDEFETPIWNLKVNINLAQKLLDKYPDNFINSPIIFEKEHSLETQLPFIRYISDKIQILPLIYWETNVIEIWNILSKISDEEDTFFIVSTDLSHYEEYEKACKIDADTIQAFLSKDIKTITTTMWACWTHPWLSLTQISIKKNWEVKLLKYLNSGDTAWGKERVVWYGSILYYS